VPVVPYDPPVKRALFIALGVLVLLGIGLVVAVTATSDEPSLLVIWAALAGTLAALVIVLVLESSGSAGGSKD
jgi:RsiW-degrading membrane proteinase PrsW (M82 family)